MRYGDPSSLVNFSFKESLPIFSMKFHDQLAYLSILPWVLSQIDLTGMLTMN